MSGRRRWSELSTTQQRGVAAAAVGQVALFLAAALSIRRTAPERVRGPKAVWYAACFVNWIGPLAWFAVGRRRADQ
jgi:hypothetical protein